MKSGSEDWVFCNEKYFLLIRVETAVYKDVSESLDVLLFFGLDEPLVDDFFFHLHGV